MTNSKDSNVEGTKLIAQALAMHRNVANIFAIKHSSELPQGIEFLLKVANGENDPMAIATLKTGATSKELKLASIKFIEKVSFSPKADPYRVLGLNPLADEEQCKTHYRLMIRLFHPDRGIAGHAYATEYSSRINQAFTEIKKLQTRTNHPDVINRYVWPSNFKPRKSPPAKLKTDSKHHHFLYQLTPTRVLISTGLVATIFVGITYMNNQGSGLLEVPANLINGDANHSEVENRSKFIVSESSKYEPRVETVPVIALPHKGGNGDLLPTKENTIQKVASLSPLTMKPLSKMDVTPLTEMHDERPSVFTPSNSKPLVNIAKLKSQVAAPSNVDVNIARISAEPSSITGNLSSSDKPVEVSPTQKNASATVEARDLSLMNTEPTDEDLHGVIAQFISSYYKGDINNFMALIDDNIHTDEPGGKLGLQRVYARLFNNSKSREMVLRNLHWQKSDTSKIGLTDYRVKVMRVGEDVFHDYTGSLKIEVEKSNGKPLIKGFYNQPDST